MNLPEQDKLKIGQEVSRHTEEATEPTHVVNLEQVYSDTSGAGINKGNVLSIPNPKGAKTNLFSSNASGAIKIQFPVPIGHVGNFCFQIQLLGQTWAENPKDTAFIFVNGVTGSGTLNVFGCSILTGDVGSNYPVRFGNDGVNQCMWIGELSHKFAYVSIGVSNLLVGRVTSGNRDDWKGDFDISRVNSFDTVQVTLVDNLPVAKNSGGGEPENREFKLIETDSYPFVLEDKSKILFVGNDNHIGVLPDDVFASGDKLIIHNSYTEIPFTVNGDSLVSFYSAQGLNTTIKPGGTAEIIFIGPDSAFISGDLVGGYRQEKKIHSGDYTLINEDQYYFLVFTNTNSIITIPDSLDITQPIKGTVWDTPAMSGDTLNFIAETPAKLDCTVGKLPKVVLFGSFNLTPIYNEFFLSGDLIQEYSIRQSPDGTLWKVAVNDSGVEVITEL